MNRLYRLAVDLYEKLPPTSFEDDSWRPLDKLQKMMDEDIPSQEREKFVLTRPRIGGYLWDSKDASDRNRIADLLISGNESIKSLQPVVDVLLGSSAHEDFSDRFSWIKEDFERKFYSKRSKMKITLVESVDDCAYYDGTDTPGYDDILFRDIMAFFDAEDRRVILALRQGRTKSGIAEQLGYSGHSAISRRAVRIERRIRQLLAK
ncbi:MAG TPA: hypothetical protein VG711_11810 [Phycisphaerales bacterium]|nr:hypothetical protein [Phycisphaerales bacterium]